MVYIIDDDQHVRDGFTVLLKSACYECIAYDSAEMFLKCYKTGMNDLIILDMNLIGINGCTLLEKLEATGIKPPVIVVTAFDQQRYRECCKHYGVMAYMRKPVDGVALIDLVKFNLDIKVANNKN
jgi:two-component system response regulator FixJ